MVTKLVSVGTHDLRVGDVLVNSGGYKWQVVAIQPSPRGPRPIVYVLCLRSGKLDQWDANTKPYEVHYLRETK